VNPLTDQAQVTLDLPATAARNSGSAPRSAATNALAVAVVALSTGAQVALYLRDFGATHRTDGLIAAFAVYSLVVVLGQLLRTTAVPLLSGVAPRLSRLTFGWAIVVIAVVLAGVAAALTPVIGHVIANAAGPAGRQVAIASLYVMAPAMGLQIIGAGLAMLGALDERIEAVAVAYMASAVCGLAAFFALRGAVGEEILAWTMLTASIVLVCGLLVGSGFRIRRAPSLAVIGNAVLALLRSLPLPASFVVMYPITLALLPHDRPGQITLFGLAYGACSYLVGFTGQALSMTDAVALSRIDVGAEDQRRAVATRAFRYSLLLAAPGLGVAIIAGTPVLGVLLPSASHGSNSYFATYALLLIPWLVATLALWATLPVLLSKTGLLSGRRIAKAVSALLAVHIVATLAGRVIAGFDGAVFAMVAAPVAFVAVALRIAVPHAAPSMARTTAIIVATAALSFGLLELAVRILPHPGPVPGILAALAGALLYAVLAARAYPDAARTFARLLGRK
jgi:hypothetical protein